jgi:predicted RNA-binding protein with PUA-like domain
MKHWLMKCEPSAYSIDDLELEDMIVTRKGSRLSIQPVTKSEFEIVAKLGKKRGS